MEIDSHTSDLKVNNYIEEQHKVFFYATRIFTMGNFLGKNSEGNLRGVFKGNWGTDEVTTRQKETIQQQRA